MKIYEIITEETLVEKHLFAIGIDKLIAGLGINAAQKALIKKASDAIISKWSDEILAAQAAKRAPRAFDVADELRALGYERSVIDQIVRNPSLMRSLKADAEAAAAAAMAAGARAVMGAMWDKVISTATFLGIAVPIGDCAMRIIEDSRELKGEQFQTAAQIHLKRCVAEVAASLAARGVIPYFFKLPAGAQSWFGWIPGFTKITDAFAKLGPSAQAAAQAFFITPPGREMIAEYFVSNAFGAAQAEWVRRLATRYLKDLLQPIIDKLQDFGDPSGAPARQDQRAQQQAAQAQLSFDPTKEREGPKYKYDYKGQPLN